MVDFETFLFKAIESGGTYAVASLLESGASPNSTTCQYGQPRTAFWVAALRQKEDICRLLLANGADIRLHINDCGKEFPNMLYMVIWSTELVMDLIELGLDPYASSTSGFDLLWWARFAGNKTLIERLKYLGIGSVEREDFE